MKKFKLPHVRMKFALAVSIMLFAFGIGVILGGVSLHSIADKTVADLQPVADSYLSSAVSTLESVNNAITAAQPSLTSASQLTGEATNTLTGLSSAATDAGNKLNWFTVPLLNWRIFGSQADVLLNAGSQIQGIASNLQNIGASLSGTSAQLENIKASLSGIRANLENTRSQLPAYFYQAHLTVLLVTVGIPGFLGLVIALGGGAILNLRREINKISDKIAIGIDVEERPSSAQQLAEKVDVKEPKTVFATTEALATFYCQYCGKENETDAIFCQSCGKNIS